MSGPTVDTSELRKAFGCFATGITVVTALEPGRGAVGITANSFSSVSLKPPLVLWCVDKRSTTFDVFMTSPNFVVSVLDACGADVAARFASKGGHVIEGIDTIPTELGPPTFADSLAVFECNVHARYAGGDHVIMVGEVLSFMHLSESDCTNSRPLVYFRGRFENLIPPTG